MDIGSICQKSVVTVNESDELTTAAQLMREQHIGSLVDELQDVSGSIRNPQRIAVALRP